MSITKEFCWQEFAQMDLTGRELVLCEAQGSLRGTIDGFEPNKDGLKIKLRKREAQIYDPQTGTWGEEKIRFEGPHIGRISVIQQWPDGTVAINIPYVGPCYISPPGHSLELPSARGMIASRS